MKRTIARILVIGVTVFSTATAGAAPTGLRAEGHDSRIDLVWDRVVGVRGRFCALDRVAVWCHSGALLCATPQPTLSEQSSENLTRIPFGG